MQINTNTLNTLDIQSSGKVSNMKLDQESQAMIFQMFTGGLYSDPIGTVIREIASNCFDSHVEAGVDSAENPVVIELKKEVSGNFIIFTDKGVGMSPDRIENIYGTYFKSTKNKTNDQIGGFGLGGKTPLAYTESFYIITRFDGIEYVYNVFEGNNVPCIELLSQQSTKLPNGTDVKIPVKEYDIMEFEKKTLRQLYYFENIIFKGFSDAYVSNDYSIIKGKNFLYRGTEYSDHIHVCYGKVAYPLDYDALGIDKYSCKLPIALRIEIGELDGTGVTPSREALKYTKNNVRIILNKIDKVKDELKKRLVKQYQSVVSLDDYYRATENFGDLYFDDQTTIYLGNIVSKNDIVFDKFKYKDLNIPSSNSIISKFYDHKLYGKKYPVSRWGRDEKDWSGSLSTMSEYKNMYYVKDEFNRKVAKQGYLRTLVSTENFYIFTPHNIEEDLVMDSLLKEFGVLKKVGKDGEVTFENTIPVSKGKKLIKELFADVQKIVESNCVGNYDDVIVPKDFILARKKERLSKDILKTTIPIKDHYSNMDRVTLKQLNNHKGRIYYGFQDDTYALGSAFEFMYNLIGNEHIQNAYNVKRNNSKGTLFISIAKNNEKYMKMLDRRAFHINDFHKTFTVRKLDKLVNDVALMKVKNIIQDDLCSVFGNKIFKNIDEEVYNDYHEIRERVRNLNLRLDNYQIQKIKNQIGIDLNNLNVKIDIQDKLNNLIKLTEKNNNRLKWFELPYSVDLNRKDHRELVDMIRLVFEK